MEELHEIVENKYKNQFITVSNAMIRAKENTTLLESKIEALAMNRLSTDMRQTFKKDSRGEDYAVNYVILPANEIAELMMRKYGKNDKVNGCTYKDIREASISMEQKFFIIEDRETKRFVMDHMYGRIAYDKGKLYIEFNPSMEKYFLGLKQNFSKLKLPILFSFKHNGGFQLYKLLKSYAYPPNLSDIDMSLSQEELPTFSVSWNLTELKMEMGYIDISEPLLKKEGSKKNPDWEKMEKDWEKLQTKRDDKKKAVYKRWSDYYTRVILPGVQEINDLSDIYIKDIKKQLSGRGGRVTGLTFVIQHNKAYYEKQSPNREQDIIDITSKTIELTNEQKEDFYDEMSEFIEEKLKIKDLRLIAEEAGYDMDRIKRAYRLAERTDNIKNIVGWLITAIRNDYDEPVKKNSSKKHGFTERTYDYEALEREALAANQ